MKNKILLILSIAIIFAIGIWQFTEGRIYNPTNTSSLVPTSRTLTAGTGLTGGGDLSADRTFTNNGVLSLTASSSIGLSNATGTVNISAKNYSITFIIENPTASENDGMFIFKNASTITDVKVVNKSLGDTVTFGLGYSSSMATASSSLYNLFTTAQTVTATTTPVTLTINASSTPVASDVLKFWTTAASSSQLIITTYYNEN